MEKLREASSFTCVRFRYRVEVDLEFIVRRCGAGDEAALSLLGRATFLETYAGRSEAADLLAYAEAEHSIESYRLWLANEFAHIWAVETAVGRSAIGYLVALILPNAVSGPEIEIKRLYLLYRFHRNGLGQLLMNEVLAAARQRRLAAAHSRRAGDAFPLLEEHAVYKQDDRLHIAGST